jgi:myo-inositol-1(or 4)-monophosphatase
VPYGRELREGENMKETENIISLAREAAVEAGKYIFEHIGKIRDISYKEGVNNLVTDVDRASESIIMDKIKEAFPEHSILAEESGEHFRDEEFKWVIDPLDGTVNYAHTFPFFCVSIGVMKGSAAKVAVVYDPVRDELFTAQEGGGAYVNDAAIKVSSAPSLKDSLVATGFAYTMEGKASNMALFAKIMGKAQALRRAGSAALDLCYVACGRMDGFWELNLSPWDTAAGQLIVSEAGGEVSTLDRGKYDIHKKEILATNGIIHDELSNILTGSDPANS